MSVVRTGQIAKKVAIGLGDSLASSKRQAIARTNYDQIY